MKTLELTLSSDPVFKKYGYFFDRSNSHDMHCQAYLLEGFVCYKEDKGQWLPYKTSEH